ncbi:MAG: type II toxin-antitoxin system prevent-host-death family antitoxin [Patescibacteria group bacterium]
MARDITTVSAREAKNRFGMLKRAVRRAPVTITNNGEPELIVMSPEEYKLIARYRVLMLADQLSAEAKKRGLTQKKLRKILDELGA